MDPQETNNVVIEKKKSKKGLKILLVFLGIIVLLGVFYFLNDKYEWIDIAGKKEEKTSEIDEKEDKLVSKIDSDKEYVYLEKEWEITDKGDNVNYSDWLKDVVFKVQQPVINIDNSYIKRINNEIENSFNLYKSSVVYNDTYDTGSRQLEELTTQEYVYYINDNILSFILKKQYYFMPGEGFPMAYETYNIDLKTGNLIENVELLKVKKLSESDVIKALEKSLKDNKIVKCTKDNLYVDDCYKDIDLSMDNIMYLNDKNKLTVIVNIETPLTGTTKEIVIE